MVTAARDRLLPDPQAPPLTLIALLGKPRTLTAQLPRTVPHRGGGKRVHNLMLCLGTRPRLAGERDGGAEGTQLAGDGQARDVPPLEDLDELHGCPAVFRHPRCPLSVHHVSECLCFFSRGRDKPGTFRTRLGDLCVRLIFLRGNNARAFLHPPPRLLRLWAAVVRDSA